MGCGTCKKSYNNEVKTRKITIILYPGQFIHKLEHDIYEKYKKIKKIGSGSFGKVLIVEDNNTHDKRALKVINKFAIQNEEMLSKLMNEVEILKTVDHPNIVKLYEFYEDHFNLYLIMELYTGGDLLEHILEEGFLNESQAAIYTKQILSVLIYLNSLNIVHRDIKLENILIESSSSNNIKLIDFGAATFINQNKKISTKIGTLNYIAPEVLKGPYNEKCDIWSCGIMLYILLSGNHPFPKKKKSDKIRHIKNGAFRMSGGIWEEISEEAKDLLRNMIEINPSKRISAKQAYHHPWFDRCESPEIQKNLLETVSKNLLSFHHTTKLQKAVIRYIATQLLTKNEIEELTAIFKSIDSMGRGKISASDLNRYWVKIFAEELSEEELNNIMDTIDTDKSGYIEYSEFLVAAMDRKKLLSTKHLDDAFSAFDYNKNKKISASELQYMLGNQNLEIKLFNNLLKEVNESNSNEISYKEFKTMMFSLLRSSSEKL